MEKFVIFGNSGSGKSTLAKELAKIYEAEHFDLDTVAWKSDRPGVRRDFEDSRKDLLDFIEEHESWVIEGCYADLLKVAAEHCTELIFLNPGIETCVENCRRRPWEPHKYATPEAQDKNLQMLINWVREYETRDDEFSLLSHRRLFDSHTGNKVEYLTNEETQHRTNQL